MRDLLLNLDRRVVYLFVLLGIAIPMFLPVRLPVRLTDEVRGVHETIEGIADAGGGTVLLSFDYGPSAMPELQPMALALLRHCFRRDLKVVAMCLWPEGVGLAQQALDVAAGEAGRAYGEDYAFLGYKTGFGSLLINMGQDFRDAFPKDVQGNRTDSLAVTRPISSLRDLDYVVCLGAGNTPDQVWLPFGQEKYKFPFATGCTAVMAPDMYPFLQSGQMNGLIGGLAGAAEYEKLVDTAGSATAGMTSQSMVHLVIILFIALGNLVYFLYGRSARRGGEA